MLRMLQTDAHRSNIALAYDIDAKCGVEDGWLTDNAGNYLQCTGEAVKYNEGIARCRVSINASLTNESMFTMAAAFHNGGGVATRDLLVFGDKASWGMWLAYNGSVLVLRGRNIVYMNAPCIAERFVFGLARVGDRMLAFLNGGQCAEFAYNGITEATTAINAMDDRLLAFKYAAAFESADAAGRFGKGIVRNSVGIGALGMPCAMQDSEGLFTLC